ncbi:MAG: Dual-action metallo-peptidase [Bacteroidetes bacterium]|jgi:hypothetical protein|nr:Dual-action metallo-peptidase [Bacteroidota bacterium]
MKTTKRKKIGMRISKNVILSLFVLATLASCKKEVPVSPAKPAMESPATTTDYGAIISSMGFSIEKMEDYGDFLLVEEDIMFTKEKLDARMADGATQKTTQASTGLHLDRTPVSNILVYVDPSIPVGGVDDWRADLSTAMAHWNNITDCIVNLTITTNSGLADITVRSDANALPDNYQAIAEFPANSSDPGYQIRINLDFNSNMTVSSGQKVYNMVHEIGHCIAFRHTNWSAAGESSAFEIGHGCPATDPNSVMNGGTALSSWTSFSTYDDLAAKLVYPAWADYTQLGGVVWAGTEAVTSWGSYIYAMNNSRFYQIDPANGNYTQLGGAVWAGTDAMTSLGNSVYAVNNSRIYRIVPATGAYTQVGSAVWGGTNAMTGYSGYIYLVQNSRFYQVDPATGTYIQLGGAVWANTEAMTSLGSYIYIVQNSRLYQVNSSTGAYTQLGGAVWGGTAAMSGIGSYLYIIENDMYYKVDPANGNYTRLGGPVWAGTDGMAPLGTYNYVIENSRFYKVNSI